MALNRNKAFYLVGNAEWTLGDQSWLINTLENHLRGSNNVITYSTSQYGERADGRSSKADTPGGREQTALKQNHQKDHSERGCKNAKMVKIYRVVLPFATVRPGIQSGHHRILKIKRSQLKVF